MDHLIGSVALASARITLTLREHNRPDCKQCSVAAQLAARPSRSAAVVHLAVLIHQRHDARAVRLIVGVQLLQRLQVSRSQTCRQRDTHGGGGRVLQPSGLELAAGPTCFHHVRAAQCQMPAEEE